MKMKIVTTWMDTIKRNSYTEDRDYVQAIAIRLNSNVSVDYRTRLVRLSEKEAVVTIEHEVICNAKTHGEAVFNYFTVYCPPRGFGDQYCKIELGVLDG